MDIYTVRTNILESDCNKRKGELDAHTKHMERDSGRV